MVPLMEAARDASRALASNDPIAAGLAPYLEPHIPEELHADFLGVRRWTTLRRSEWTRWGYARGGLHEDGCFVGTLFYWIWHRHPVAILGFLSLEAFDPYTEAVEQLIEKMASRARDSGSCSARKARRGAR